MTLKLKGLRLRILPGHEVFLISPTNAPVQVWAGCLCAGFLKGKLVTGALDGLLRKGDPNSGRLGGRYAAN